MKKKGAVDVSSSLQNHVAQFLLGNNTNQVVNHGKIGAAAMKYGVSKRTIHNIWASTRQQINQGMPVHFTSNKLGAIHEKTINIPAQKMKDIPLSKRGTIRKLAVQLSISKSSVGRWVKNGEIRAHTNAIKPELTATNKLQRLSYSLKAVTTDAETKKLKFCDMYDVVHIDEKWFYMAKECERYYMLPEETDPYRSCKSKRFIPKIMLMCAVARPRPNIEGEPEFDGKIGLWPFTKEEPSARSSKNRPRGTMVTKPIESITKEVIKSCIITQIIPAIKAKWPPNASKTIYIQQDNVKPHIRNDDPDFRKAASSDEFNIQLMHQPPNYLDTNINDLGWFKAIQSLQVDTTSYNIDQLIHNVLLSFEKLSAITLNKVFLSLQSCLTKIIRVKGHNNYKIPHIGKDRMIREDRLPISLELDEDQVKEGLNFLNQVGEPYGVSYNLAALAMELGF